MSVTFAAELPLDCGTEPCLCAQMAPGWFDAPVEVLREFADEACPFCDGAGVERVERRLPGTFVNWANDNAARVLGLLGLNPWGGTLEVDEIPVLLRAITRTLNDSAIRSTVTRDAFESPSRTVTRVEVVDGMSTIVRGHTCAVICGGLDDDGITDRLRSLASVLRLAQDHRVSVSWS